MVLAIVALVLIGLLTYAMLVASARTKDRALEDREQMEYLRQYRNRKS